MDPILSKKFISRTYRNASNNFILLSSLSPSFLKLTITALASVDCIGINLVHYVVVVPLLYIVLFSALDKLTVLACDSTSVNIFSNMFLNIHQNGILTVLTWLVPHETAAISAHSVVLCTPYNCAPCHFIQSHIPKVYACLAVTCYLHFWQNDQDLLHTTVVTWRWTDTEIRVSTESWPRRRKFYPATHAGIRTHDLSITSPAL